MGRVVGLTLKRTFDLEQAWEGKEQRCSSGARSCTNHWERVQREEEMKCYCFHLLLTALASDLKSDLQEWIVFVTAKGVSSFSMWLLRTRKGRRSHSILVSPSATRGRRRKTRGANCNPSSGLEIITGLGVCSLSAIRHRACASPDLARSARRLYLVSWLPIHLFRCFVSLSYCRS